MGENTRLRARMRHLGMTQTELADALSTAIEDVSPGTAHVSERTVRYLLTGRTRWPQFRTRRALEAVFGCPVEDLGFCPPSARCQQEESVLRRTFITSAAGAAVAALPVSAPARLGTSDLARLQVAFDDLVADDDQHGGAPVEKRARAFAEKTLDLQKARSLLSVCVPGCINWPRPSRAQRCGPRWTRAAARRPTSTCSAPSR